MKFKLNKSGYLSIFFIIFLLFLKTDYRLVTDIYCCGDDHDYFMHASTIAFDFDLDYSNQMEGIEDKKLLALAREFKLFNEEENFDLEKEISNKSLSSGQMQKISFIRSLLSDAEVLLLDESTSNLDQDTKKLIFEILDKENLTIINATHSPQEFKSYDYHLKIEIEDEKRILQLLKQV